MEPTIESTHMAISVVVESFKGFLFQNLYLSWKHWMIKSRNVHQKKKSNPKNDDAIYEQPLTTMILSESS